MSENKFNNRSNITTIIHDLKVEYRRTFNEKFPTDDKNMEIVLNEAAKLVKKHKTVTWITDTNGKKTVKVTDYVRRAYITSTAKKKYK